MDASTPLARSHEISRKVALVFQKRMENAQNHFRERLADAAGHDATRGVLALSPASFDPLAGYRYAVDAMQRSILFWDTLRQRGNDFVENRRGTQAGSCISTTKRCSTAALRRRSTTRC